MVQYKGIIQPAVSLSIVLNRDNTHIILSWLKEHSKFAGYCHKLLSKVSNKNNLNKVITQLCFGESEDTCISPRLWDSLSLKDRKQISSAIKFTRGYDLPAPLPEIIWM